MEKQAFFLFFAHFISVTIPAQTTKEHQEHRAINPDSVTIARDRWGVPHIFAKTAPEVAYGLAWSHAENDFKTIQLTLLAGKGLLGRLQGKQGTIIDSHTQY